MTHRQHCPARENIRRACWCPTLDQVADETRAELADRVRALPTPTDWNRGEDRILFRSQVLAALRDTP